ncbi:LysM domain protein [Sulfitobacter noctilucicola]|nr:LysM domain protein [Sulfitobacter noctilucicola]
MAIGGTAFLIGAAVAFGYAQWSSQQEKLAQMTQMVEEMQARPAVSPAAPAPQAQMETVTREAPVDLLTPVATPSAPFTTPVAQSGTVPALQAVVASASQDAALPDSLAQSTAEKLRALVESASLVPDTPSLDPAVLPAPAQTTEAKIVSDARRIETLAVIQAGVQELVTAVVKGNYDIHTDYEDEHFSGRIHFAFVGHEEDQTALEVFLSQAAEKGIVAHSDAVVDADGKVNGHILLFDLVERALQNGTPEEQRAGEKMRREAVALLAESDPSGSPENAAGERYYTVEAGDSLAYIALQFYGNTKDFMLIYDANRNKISSPNRILVGQRLVIPKA